MFRYLTAGESHGPALVGILDGLPANLPLDVERINETLARRQGGYGRGRRMQIERDEIEFLAGVRGSRTLGSPIAVVVRNRDFENVRALMDPLTGGGKELTNPRPGHADYAGALKYRHRDLRNVLERASARETAMRVGLGAICAQFLEALGIRTRSYVHRIGDVEAPAELTEFVERRRREQRCSLSRSEAHRSDDRCNRHRKSRRRYARRPIHRARRRRAGRDRQQSPAGYAARRRAGRRAHGDANGEGGRGWARRGGCRTARARTRTIPSASKAAKSFAAAIAPAESKAA